MLPKVEPGFLRKSLPESPPEEGTTFENILEDTKNIYYPGVLNWESPRFFAYFPSLNQMVGAVVEMFSACFHTPGFMYAMSPSHTEL